MVSSEVRGLRASLQVFGERRVSAGVGQDSQRSGGDHHQADRQPIQTVGEVERVRTEYHYQRHKIQNGAAPKTYVQGLCIKAGISSEG